jgi:hypothetical protein
VRVNKTRPNVPCSTCGTLVEEPERIEDRQPCPTCGSQARRFGATITDTVGIRDLVGLKGKRPGQKRPFLEAKQGDELYRVTGEWHRLQRVVDRDAGRYFEHIEDERGQVVRHVEQPLRDHQGRGSAKPRPPRQDGS